MSLSSLAAVFFANLQLLKDALATYTDGRRDTFRRDMTARVAKQIDSRVDRIRSQLDEHKSFVAPRRLVDEVSLKKEIRILTSLCSQFYQQIEARMEKRVLLGELLNAVDDEDIDYLHKLIQQNDFDVNEPFGEMRDGDMTTLLTFVVAKGNFPMLEFMVKMGAKVNNTPKVNDTLLSMASTSFKERRSDALLLLIGLGAYRMKGETFVYVCMDHDVDALELLLNTVCIDLTQSLSKSNPYMTLLSVAILSRSVDVLNVVLDAGVDFTAECGQKHLTPVQFATLHSSLPIVHALIERGASAPWSVHGLYIAQFGFDVYKERVARSIDNLSMKEILCRALACNDANPSWPPMLVTAIATKHDDVATTLFGLGVNVNERHENSGFSPLLAALLLRNIGVCSKLVALGAQHAHEKMFFDAQSKTLFPNEVL